MDMEKVTSNSLVKRSSFQHNLHKFGKLFKKIFINTILVHLISFGISISLTIFRDEYVNQMCWSPKLECSCNLKIAIFYIFWGVFFEILCPISLLSVIMFILDQKFVRLWQTKLFFVLEMILAVFVPYMFAFYYEKSSPRVYTYVITSTLAILYSLTVKKIKKLDWKTYFQKIKYPVFFVYSALFYFVLMVYVMPILYFFLEEIAQENTENAFQIILCVFVLFYEIFIDYVFNKIAETIDNYENHNMFIILAKYYYIMFYSLRVGNILFLKITDWGFYFQFFSFLLFIFHHTTGISLFSYLILKPLLTKLLSKQNFFQQYLMQNTLTFLKWFKWFNSPKQQRISYKRRINKSANSKLIFVKKMDFSNIKPPQENSNEMSKSTRILIYQKMEFILIYVPTLLFLWLYRSWRNPEPFYLFTIDCSFKVKNIDFQQYSIILLIMVDVIATAVFVTFMYFKGKLKYFYDFEKTKVLYRVAFYIACQITFEQWMSHFSSFGYFFISEIVVGFFVFDNVIKFVAFFCSKIKNLFDQMEFINFPGI